MSVDLTRPNWWFRCRHPSKVSLGRGLNRVLLSKGCQDASEMLQDDSKAAPSPSRTLRDGSETPSGGLKTPLNASKTSSGGAIEAFSLNI